MDAWQEESGFRDLAGFRLRLWEPGRAEVAVTLDPRHTNRSGGIHGGVLAALVDTACGYAGTHVAAGEKRFAFTLSLTTSFIAEARLGTEIVARARATERRTLFFADCEVMNAEGRLIARGEGVFKYRVARD